MKKPRDIDEAAFAEDARAGKSASALAMIYKIGYERAVALRVKFVGEAAAKQEAEEPSGAEDDVPDTWNLDTEVRSEALDTLLRSFAPEEIAWAAMLLDTPQKAFLVAHVHQRRIDLLLPPEMRPPARE